MAITLAAQLYTVRDLTATYEQTVNTLNAIKAIGYTAVQLFGDQEKLRLFGKACAATGMQVVGILSDPDTYRAMGEELFAFCKQTGITDLGISAFATDEISAKQLITDANALAKTAAHNGLTFSYHNHAAEFVKLPCGKTIMQLYTEGFDPAINWMPDTYWLAVGGIDVRHFLDTNCGRTNILHLKDVKYTPDGPTFAEVGQGNLWFEGILNTAVQNGISTWVVEQDRCDGSPLDSLKISYEYVTSLLEG